MKFRIVGADKETGCDVDTTIDTPDRATAEAWASRQGILWSELIPMEHETASRLRLARTKSDGGDHRGSRTVMVLFALVAIIALTLLAFGELGCSGVAITVVILGVLGAIAWTLAENEKVSLMLPDERRAYLAAKEESRLQLQYGPINPDMICPHCQSKKCVRTKTVDRKKGVSGDKATAALLTGGLSVLVTDGLSRKERLTQAYCDSCRNRWDF